MDYRFNSFYQDAMHPFVDAMINVLSGNGKQVNRLRLLKPLFWASDAKLEEDRLYMKKVSAEIVERRRECPSEKKDLLNAMVNGVDPKTGEKLRDELIIAQMVGFLIAGKFAISTK